MEEIVTMVLAVEVTMVTAIIEVVAVVTMMVIIGKNQKKCVSLFLLSFAYRYKKLGKNIGISGKEGEKKAKGNLTNFQPSMNYLY